MSITIKIDGLLSEFKINKNENKIIKKTTK